MFEGLILLFIHIMEPLLNVFITVFSFVLPGSTLDFLLDTSFNIYLFSDTGWFTQPIPLYDMLQIILVILIFIFLIRLLWKGTKKFINMIFGVFRV